MPLQIKTMPTGVIHTLYLPGNELPTARRPADWLVAAERAELAMLSDERRRRQWLAGRWAAKQLLVREGLAGSLSDVEIRSRDARRQNHRPRIRIGLRPFAGSLSIAHTANGALAAFSASEQLSVGVDLVDLDEMAAAGDSGGFARLWFTPPEQYWIAADRPRRTATLWGIKEAVYKACQSGESWSPRDLAVWPRTHGYRCTYRGMAINGLRLEIDQVDGHVAVVASLLHIAQINAGGVSGRPPLIATLRRSNVSGDSLQRGLILEQAS